MIEIFKVMIAILGMAGLNVAEGNVDCSDGANAGKNAESVNMVRFEGKAEGPWFTGTTLPGGVDTQIRRNGKGTLSARYMLEGVDYTGDSCRIFIENNAVDGEPWTHPTVLTDSRALASLNGADLRGSIVFADNALEIHIGKPLTDVPKEAFEKQEQQGHIEEFRYDTRRNGKRLNKRAMVYLPYGYDDADAPQAYDVVYLMHGGGDNATSFFSEERSPLPVGQALDYLIANGLMKPLIVVCPTFYDDDLNIGKNGMADAVAATRNFNAELRNHLIPAVETRYRTHYRKGEKHAVENSRAHRAFGGFSMGALCTWYQLADDAAAVGTFLPLSGDLWIYNDAGEKLPAADAARWLNDCVKNSGYADNFRVFAYTGSGDIAYAPEKALVEALYALPASHFTPANMEFGVKPEATHWYGAVNLYLYHAFPRLFPQE